uniref:Uncharacterized protein n=1 Tax=Octopus bimaculoides TaxID=37653 RepID=A0A0L8IBN2_OCTBM
MITRKFVKRSILFLDGDLAESLVPRVKCLAAFRPSLHSVSKFRRGRLYLSSFRG